MCVKAQILILEGLEGICDLKFLTSWQVFPVLLVCKTHFD